MLEKKKRVKNMPIPSTICIYTYFTANSCVLTVRGSMEFNIYYKFVKWMIGMGMVHSVCHVTNQGRFGR